MRDPNGAPRRRPKRKRGSSEKWEADKLTQQEIDEYKRTTGQTQSWEAFVGRRSPVVD